VAIKGHLRRKFATNKELSDARAGRAAEALRNGGVSGKLWADGYGESNAIATNQTPGGGAQNRRVEIIVTSEPEGEHPQMTYADDTTAK